MNFLIILLTIILGEIFGACISTTNHLIDGMLMGAGFADIFTIPIGLNNL
jgi:hypothetical protein